jgi:hypothetical protein
MHSSTNKNNIGKIKSYGSLSLLSKAKNKAFIGHEMDS